MEIIEGIKRKFASANCKLIRICTITGNVEKLEKLLTDNKEIEVGKVQYVSSRYICGRFLIMSICVLFSLCSFTHL